MVKSGSIQTMETGESVPVKADPFAALKAKIAEANKDRDDNFRA